jgi:hypothetical protein
MFVLLPATGLPKYQYRPFGLVVPMLPVKFCLIITLPVPVLAEVVDLCEKPALLFTCNKPLFAKLCITVALPFTNNVPSSVKLPVIAGDEEVLAVVTVTVCPLKIVVLTISVGSVVAATYVPLEVHEQVHVLKTVQSPLVVAER